MNKIEVELFSDQGDGAILRLPERKFSGLLLQEDSLRNLAEMAERVHMLSNNGSDELKEEAALLAESLRDLCSWYESFAE
ncbi:hypothetical protein ISP15_04935 [Dyella jejuensis]|uniref:Uncharacterized protein n=1 Tax=Dyella jejuensis TaxID=1432009 RepID=A0ABW8JF07_9GAMM